MRGDNTNTNNSIMMATAAMDISGDSHHQQLPQQTPLPPNSTVKRHNPDHDNLKSLLKKPTKHQKSSVSDHKKNRVIFNEKRNEFFDADYIILIREDCCDYDDEDEEEEDDDNCSACTCNQHEMIRLTCCEPNCNCNGYVDRSGYEQTPPSPKYAPPIEFVDAVTLSPPDGYKDMDLGEQQIIALQQLAMRQQQQQQQQRIAQAAAAAAQHLHGNSAAVCRECRECSAATMTSTQHTQHTSDGKFNYFNFVNYHIFFKWQRVILLGC